MWKDKRGSFKGGQKHAYSIGIYHQRQQDKLYKQRQLATEQDNAQGTKRGQSKDDIVWERRMPGTVPDAALPFILVQPQRRRQRPSKVVYQETNISLLFIALSLSLPIVACGVMLDPSVALAAATNSGRKEEVSGYEVGFGADICVANSHELQMQLASGFTLPASFQQKPPYGESSVSTAIPMPKTYVPLPVKMDQQYQSEIYQALKKRCFAKKSMTGDALRSYFKHQVLSKISFKMKVEFEEYLLRSGVSDLGALTMAEILKDPPNFILNKQESSSLETFSDSQLKDQYLDMIASQISDAIEFTLKNQGTSSTEDTPQVIYLMTQNIKTVELKMQLNTAPFSEETSFRQQHADRLKPLGFLRIDKRNLFYNMTKNAIANIAISDEFTWIWRNFEAEISQDIKRKLAGSQKQPTDLVLFPIEVATLDSNIILPFIARNPIITLKNKSPQEFERMVRQFIRTTCENGLPKPHPLQLKKMIAPTMEVSTKKHEEIKANNGEQTYFWRPKLVVFSGITTILVWKFFGFCFMRHSSWRTFRSEITNKKTSMVLPEQKKLQAQLSALEGEIQILVLSCEDLMRNPAAMSWANFEKLKIALSQYNTGHGASSKMGKETSDVIQDIAKCQREYEQLHRYLRDIRTHFTIVSETKCQGLANIALLNTLKRESESSTESQPVTSDESLPLKFALTKPETLASYQLLSQQIRAISEKIREHEFYAPTISAEFLNEMERDPKILELVKNFNNRVIDWRKISEELRKSLHFRQQQAITQMAKIHEEHYAALQLWETTVKTYAEKTQVTTSQNYLDIEETTEQDFARYECSDLKTRHEKEYKKILSEINRIKDCLDKEKECQQNYYAEQLQGITGCKTPELQYLIIVRCLEAYDVDKQALAEGEAKLKYLENERVIKLSQIHAEQIIAAQERYKTLYQALPGEIQKLYLDPAYTAPMDFFTIMNQIEILEEAKKEAEKAVVAIENITAAFAAPAPILTLFPKDSHSKEPKTHLVTYQTSPGRSEYHFSPSSKDAPAAKPTYPAVSVSHKQTAVIPFFSSEIRQSFFAKRSQLLPNVSSSSSSSVLGIPASISSQVSQAFFIPHENDLRTLVIADFQDAQKRLLEAIAFGKLKDELFQSNIKQLVCYVFLDSLIRYFGMLVDGIDDFIARYPDVAEVLGPARRQLNLIRNFFMHNIDRLQVENLYLYICQEIKCISEHYSEYLTPEKAKTINSPDKLVELYSTISKMAKMPDKFQKPTVWDYFPETSNLEKITEIIEKLVPLLSLLKSEVKQYVGDEVLRAIYALFCQTGERAQRICNSEPKIWERLSNEKSCEEIYRYLQSCLDLRRAVGHRFDESYKLFFYADESLTPAQERLKSYLAQESMKSIQIQIAAFIGFACPVNLTF